MTAPWGGQPLPDDRDAAFQAFLDNLAQQDGYVSRALLRRAWEAGRRYEVERVEAIVRPRSSGTSSMTGSTADQE